MTLDVRPLFDRICIKQKKVDKIGKVFIPKTSEMMYSCEGEVLAIGPECEFTKVGDKVIWGRYVGAKIERNGEEYYLLREKDLIGIIESKEAA